MKANLTLKHYTKFVSQNIREYKKAFAEMVPASRFAVILVACLLLVDIFGLIARFSEHY